MSDFANGKRSQGELYIKLKLFYQKFRIILNNRRLTDFLAQKLRSGEIGQNFRVLLSITCYEIGINQIINYQKLQNLMKLTFSFVNKSSKSTRHIFQDVIIVLLDQGSFNNGRVFRYT